MLIANSWKLWIYWASDEQEQVLATSDIDLDTEKLTPKKVFLISLRKQYMGGVILKVIQRTFQNKQKK